MTGSAPSTPLTARFSVPLWERRPHACALALICVFSLIRLWIAASGQIDLAQDEAQYWDWSRRLQLSYYSKGPLIAWIIALWSHIFGATELGVRFGAVTGNAAVQLLLYAWLAGPMQRPRLGLIALALANTTPLFIVSGVLMTTDNPLMLCWLAGLVCLSLMPERPGDHRPFYGLALAMCLGVLSKYMMLAFAGVSLAYVFLLQRRGMLPAGHLRKTALALLAGTLAGLAPIIVWNAQNDFASFRHVGRLAGVAPAPGEAPPLIRFDRFPEYFASQLGIILPWWLGIMLWHGWGMMRHCLEGGTATRPALKLHTREKNSSSPNTPDELFDFSVPDRARSFRLNLLLCLGFWPLWLFFLAWSFHTRIYANWPAMSYVAGLIIAALGVERLAFGRTAAGLPPVKTPVQSVYAGLRGKGRKLLPLWCALSLVVCLTLHGQNIVTRFLPLPDAVNPTLRLKGWSDLGRKLEEIRLSMPNPDTVFFFSDAYDVTASLAFYLPGRPVTYCADFGRRLSQYDFWPDPNGDTALTAAARAGTGTALAQNTGPHAGWDAVFVTRVPMRRTPGWLHDMFAACGEPQVYHSEHRGEKGRTFGYLLLRGFTGKWPRLSRGIY